MLNLLKKWNSLLSHIEDEVISLMKNSFSHQFGFDDFKYKNSAQLIYNYVPKGTKLACPNAIKSIRALIITTYIVLHLKFMKDTLNDWPLIE